MTTQLEPDQLASADRFARAVILSSSLEYLVVVADHTALAEPFARRVAGSSVTTDGAPLRVRWIGWAGGAATLGQLEPGELGAGGERQLIVVDLSGVFEGELEGALAFARGLNTQRDVLSSALVGALLLCVPDWLEPHFAAAAPDLWSVVSSTALRRGVERFPAAIMDDWWERGDAAFDRRRATLAEGADVYRAGTYTFAYGFEPGAVELRNVELLDKMRRLPQYTPWSTWLIPDDAGAPYPIDGAVECWLLPLGGGGPNHADFWRAQGAGTFYLRRGYDEDAKFDPGVSFSAFLPIWRLGEALLHARDLAAMLGLRAHVGLRVRTRWDGLSARRLSSWPDQGLVGGVRPGTSRTASVSTDSLVEVGELGDLAPLVAGMTRELFECFDFHRWPPETFTHHLQQLEQRRRVS